MTDLKDLEEKVKNLEKLTAEEQPQQIKLLQEIGKELADRVCDKGWQYHN